MVSLQAAPHPALRKYIAEYVYTAFNSSELPSLKQTFLPYDFPAISFFVGPFCCGFERDFVTNPVEIHWKSSYCYYNAMITSPTTLYFKENSTVQTFLIVFTSSGFSELFRMNVSELTNQLPDFLSIAGASKGNSFLDELVDSDEFSTQVTVLDRFFLRKISRAHSESDQVREAVRKLIMTNGMITMSQLAYDTNMSLRTMQRQFTEHVGVSPKVFARFKRLHHALTLMNAKKSYSWSDIVYPCGYFDQAHFVNDFKSFTNLSPSDYAPREYALYNQIVLSKNRFTH